MKNPGLTVEVVAAKLEKHGGNVAKAARALGVRRQSLWRYIGRHPALVDVVHDIRESVKDDAETVLHKALRKGEAWAVCFYLKTQARDRGYVERQELGLDGGVDLRLVVEIVEEVVDGSAAYQAAAAGDRNGAPAPPAG
jgi:hypothetical protein